jgi:hypothetical protein
LFAEIAEPDRYVNSLQFFLTVVCGKRTIFAMKTLGENAKKSRHCQLFTVSAEARERMKED